MSDMVCEKKKENAQQQIGFCHKIRILKNGVFIRCETNATIILVNFVVVNGNTLSILKEKKCFCPFGI